MNKIKGKRPLSAVIVANGRYPHHPIPLSIIENAEYVVCCDGAANYFISQGHIPDAIVGDCDSISDENKIRFAKILHPVAEQESNDLTKSVHYCIEHGIKDITIIGGTGLREDHTIGNISLLAEYIAIANVRMITNYGVFSAINSTTNFDSYKGEKVSIFSIDQKPITTSGLKYPINNRILTNWWQGTLNESSGEQFTIETESRVIVFQVFEQ